MSAMITVAWAALRTRIGAWAAAAGAAAALLLAAYAAGRRDGRGLAGWQAANRAARAREIRDEVDRDVGRAGDPDGELRRDWRRP